jgi:hypothetical protein
LRTISSFKKKRVDRHVSQKPPVPVAAAMRKSDLRNFIERQLRHISSGRIIKGLASLRAIDAEQAQPVTANQFDRIAVNNVCHSETIMWCTVGTYFGDESDQQKQNYKKRDQVSFSENIHNRILIFRCSKIKQPYGQRPLANQRAELG